MQNPTTEGLSLSMFESQYDVNCPATRIPDVFETLDPATGTLCRIAMRLIFKFVVFLRIGMFYCLCC